MAAPLGSSGYSGPGRAITTDRQWPGRGERTARPAAAPDRQRARHCRGGGGDRSAAAAAQGSPVIRATRNRRVLAARRGGAGIFVDPPTPSRVWKRSPSSLRRTARLLPSPGRKAPTPATGSRWGNSVVSPGVCRVVVRHLGTTAAPSAFGTVGVAEQHRIEQVVPADAAHVAPLEPGISLRRCCSAADQARVVQQSPSASQRIVMIVVRGGQDPGANHEPA